MRRRSGCVKLALRASYSAAIYTSVSTDYRNRVLRTALDRAFATTPKENT